MFGIATSICVAVRHRTSQSRAVLGPLVLALLAAAAFGQTQDTTPQAIDECGTLVFSSSGCILFQGTGGMVYIPDTGRFRVGDAVRVVGTLDPTCKTICKDAAGCVRGAVLYDPAVFPCGQALPSFPGDIVTNACTTVSTAVLTLTLAGLWYTRRRLTGGRT